MHLLALLPIIALALAVPVTLGLMIVLDSDAR